MSDSIYERVSELRAWALSRIEWCGEQAPRLEAIGSYVAAGAAMTERRTLQAVLSILDDK